jgi:hypothetical protein
MSYNPSIPNATDFLSVSQGQIKTNFGQLNTVFGKDHVPFDSTPNGGLHNHVTIPNVSTDPTLSGNTIEMYMKALTGIGAPFLANATSTGVMWSGGSTYPTVTSSTGGNSSNGYVKFPNGIMIQWGNGQGSNANPSVFTFPTSFANSCFAVVISAYTGNGTPIVYVGPDAGTFTKSQFVYRQSGAGLNNPSIQFIAIGN